MARTEEAPQTNAFGEELIFTVLAKLIIIVSSVRFLKDVTIIHDYSQFVNTFIYENF